MDNKINKTIKRFCMYAYIARPFASMYIVALAQSYALPTQELQARWRRTFSGDSAAFSRIDPPHPQLIIITYYYYYYN